MYAACKSMTNLPFTDAELQNYIKEAMDVAGDGTGKIKTDEFASYLAFEAKKAYKKQQNAAQSNGAGNGHHPNPKLVATNSAGAANENGGDYNNPFMDFLSGDTTAPLKKPQLTSSASSPGMKVTVTPDPLSNLKFLICIIINYLLSISDNVGLFQSLCIDTI